MDLLNKISEIRLISRKHYRFYQDILFLSENPRIVDSKMKLSYINSFIFDCKRRIILRIFIAFCGVNSTFLDIYPFISNI